MQWLRKWTLPQKYFSANWIQEWLVHLQQIGQRRPQNRAAEQIYSFAHRTPSRFQQSDPDSADQHTVVLLQPQTTNDAAMVLNQYIYVYNYHLVFTKIVPFQKSDQL